jgi:acyl-CoA synthetase (AMP-forming)/AMP-acid ligase II
VWPLAGAGAVALVTAANVVRREPPDVSGVASLRAVLLDRDVPGWERPSELATLTAADLAAAPDARPATGVEPGDLAVILYTSGSTGTPRGVVLGHDNLLANTAQILGYLHFGSDDSVLCVLPFHYSFGQSLLLTHVAVGGRVVVDNGFAYPARTVDRLEQSRASGFSGVPSTFAILAARTDFLERPWPDLRYVTQAGGPMAVALQRRLRAALPDHVALHVMYGQTEASARLSHVPPDRLAEKFGSIGVAIPGVELTVRREDGGECAVGEVGEVVAQGPNVMRGYWNAPEETAAVLKADGLHTGDLGRRDADGFLWLVDRLKNMVKVGAHRVSAREVEEVIAGLGGVQEACVVGVPDDLLGEALEAFVVPAPGAQLAAPDVQRHCRRELPLFKVPRAVHLTEGLPRNEAGKVLRQQLRERAVAQATGSPTGAAARPTDAPDPPRPGG